MSSPQQQTNKALAYWYWNTLLGVLKPRLILIPFAIVHLSYEIPHIDARFRYKDVFVFGVRIARLQRG